MKLKLLLLLSIVGILLFVAFLPAEAATCTNPNPKKALTIPGEYNWQPFMTWLVNQGQGALCTKTYTYFYDWRIGWQTYGVNKFQRVPMAWDEGMVDDWCAATQNLQWYNGYLLFANEPTLVDQANMTPQETAQMAIDLLECTPNVQLVGPNHHPNVNCDPDWMDEFWTEFVALGGQASNIRYLGYHGYVNPCGVSAPATQLAQFRSNLPSALANKDFWITEAGWKDSNLQAWTEKWLEDWMAIEYVDLVFGYTAYRPAGYSDPWTPFYIQNGSNYNITATGLGYRASGW